MSHKLEALTTIQKLKTVWNDELVWLAPALVASLLLFYVYLATHPYPAFGAGLFMEMARQVARHGYALPSSIPYYAANGIPFAYPPLAFYALALLRGVGVDPFTITRFLPGSVTVLYLIPFYALARELLDSGPRAGFATLLVAVSPPILQWHISAGGVVRAPAMLFALTGIYTGLKLFETGERRWVVPSLVCFTLTILTHPLYAAFFVVTYLVCYACYDRTRAGLVGGAIVGVGGLVLTAPWWLQVVAAHGPSVFSAAAGTHGGLGTGVREFLVRLSVRPGRLSPFSLRNLAPVVGVFVLLRDRRYFVPLWFVTVTVVLGNPRFVFLVGALASTVLMFEVVVPFLRRELRSKVDGQRVVTFSIALVATFGMGAGTLYATSHLNSHGGSASLPQFVDNDDLAAMRWVHNHTANDSRFVVQGDTAEWFPYETGRTILVGPWGLEWTNPSRYRHELALFRTISTCPNATCLSTAFDQAGIHPQYVYVHRGSYTIRGMHRDASETLVSSLRSSGEFRLVYLNDGVAIFREVREPSIHRFESRPSRTGS